MEIKPTTTTTKWGKYYSALTRDTITNADAIEFLESIPKEKLTGMSAVNKAFTRLQVWNIFMDAAKAEKPEAKLHPISFKNMQKEYKKI